MSFCYFFTYIWIYGSDFCPRANFVILGRKLDSNPWNVRPCGHEQTCVILSKLVCHSTLIPRKQVEFRCVGGFDISSRRLYPAYEYSLPSTSKLCHSSLLTSKLACHFLIFYIFFYIFSVKATREQTLLLEGNKQREALKQLHFNTSKLCNSVSKLICN